MKDDKGGKGSGDGKGGPGEKREKRRRALGDILRRRDLSERASGVKEDPAHNEATARLIKVVESIGDSAREAVAECLSLIDQRPDEKLMLATFGNWILVVPQGTKDPRMDALLAIEMAKSKVLIDVHGFLGPIKTAEEARGAFTARMKERDEACEKMNRILDFMSDPDAEPDSGHAQRVKRFKRLREAIHRISEFTGSPSAEILHRLLLLGDFQQSDDRRGFYTHSLMNERDGKRIYVDGWGCLYLMIEACPETQTILDDILASEERDPADKTPGEEKAPETPASMDPSENIISFRPNRKPGEPRK